MEKKGMALFKKLHILLICDEISLKKVQQMRRFY